MLSDCCGLDFWDAAGGAELALCLLAGALISAAVLTWRGRSRQVMTPACRSSDCFRCHRAADLAVSVASRLTPETSERLRCAVSAWRSGADGLYIQYSADRPWWNDVYRDDVDVLQRNCPVIRDEFRTCRRAPELWRTNITPEGSWEVLWLQNQGVENAEAAALCPRTVDVVSGLGHVMSGTVFCNVGFSVLRPRTLIEEHRGPTNARLRCHLGLETPAGCSLTVGGETRTWRQGQCLLFDDSYPHHAQHRGGTGSPSRAVLLLDLWHPALTRSERRELQHLLTPHGSH